MSQISWKCLAWVFNHATARRVNLLVLIRIADHVNDNGDAFPSVATLTEETGYAKKRVYQATATLEAAGELQIERRTGRSNVYRVPTKDRFTPPPPSNVLGRKGSRDAKKDDNDHGKPF